MARLIRIDGTVAKRIAERRAELEAAWGRRVSANETVRQLLGLHLEADIDEAGPLEVEVVGWPVRKVRF